VVLANILSLPAAMIHLGRPAFQGLNHRRRTATVIPMKAERETRPVSHALRRLFNGLVADTRTCGLMMGLVLMLPVLVTGCGTFVAPPQ
jgi:Sec-independent protein secretion pathway component TatC